MTQELRQRAVRLLARREHTRAELSRKLAPHGSEEDIKTVLDELQAARLQSDARFAESYVRANAERLGTARLRHNLMIKGVSQELINAHLAPETLADELERAQIVWSKKFCTAARDASEWAKQARFLQGRGFANDIIRRLLKESASTAATETTEATAHSDEVTA